MAKEYGRWRNVGSLGEGGQARLFLVEDSKGEHRGRYVLKRLLNRGRLDLFEREVRAMEAVRHRHVLRIIDYDVTGDPAYYVAEYCEGGTLDDKIARYRGAFAAAVDVLLPIVDALQVAAAARVVHRDVKPSNILFRANGEPVLGDFGICHMPGDGRVTLTEAAMGSRQYIAPEMEAGQRGPVTSAVDVYALGKALYAMGSGGSIFDRENHRAANLYLPRIFGDGRWEHVHGLLDGMVVADPAARIPIQLLPQRLEQTVYLMEGGYAPLRPSSDITCRFCGLGVYRRHEMVRGFANNLRLQNPRALRCPHCGHIEVFDSEGIADAGWWDR